MTASLVRTGDDTTCASLTLNTDDDCDNLATFDITTEAHLLPYGRYDLIVKSGDCVCGKFPVMIKKCKVEEPGTCEGDAPICLPDRECTVEKEDECPVNDICDIWNPACGNKVGESKGIEMDWRITARD